MADGRVDHGDVAKPDLRIALEWRSWPLWTVDDGGEDTPDPRELAGPVLGAELVGWAEEYDGYWDPDDPRGPRFPDRRTELDFYARGRELAVRVAAAVGEQWSVHVQDADGGWETLS